MIMNLQANTRMQTNLKRIALKTDTYLATSIHLIHPYLSYISKCSKIHKVRHVFPVPYLFLVMLMLICSVVHPPKLHSLRKDIPRAQGPCTSAVAW